MELLISLKGTWIWKVEVFLRHSWKEKLCAWGWEVQSFRWGGRQGYRSPHTSQV